MAMALGPWPSPWPMALALALARALALALAMDPAKSLVTVSNETFSEQAHTIENIGLVRATWALELCIYLFIYIVIYS